MNETAEALDDVDVVVQPTTEIAAYSPLRAAVARMRDENAALVFDYRAKAGAKAARSHIAGLRRFRALVERTRKEAAADLIVRKRLIDDGAKEIQRSVDSMIAVHLEPLERIEAEERERVEQIRRRLAALEQLAEHDDPRVGMIEAKAVELDESWGDLLARAGQVKDRVIRRLEARIDEQRAAAEQEAARRAAEAAAERERQEVAARAAAEKARQEAEAAAARAELDARRQADQERREAAERERLAAERVAHAQAETDAARAREAEERAARERAEQEAAEAARRAQEAEQHAARVEAEARAARPAATPQEAAQEAPGAAPMGDDREHRAAVNRRAYDALLAGGVPADVARTVVTLIARGQIPAVRIDYRGAPA